ncbi:MAG: alpha/beta hydrolase [Rhodospirillaceae bacterium]|nr:alpha/beta hydrolase [Rhodospirillaceae bacterium]
MTVNLPSTRAGAPRPGSFEASNPVGSHRVRYLERGPAHARRVVICVHGLTRNARDFDPLAEALAKEGWRVICPDIVGRGDSDRLPDPAGYNYGQYQQDMMALIAHLGCAAVDWVGTSMGGLIGMMLAARPATPIRRLVINDIGPFLPQAALQRLSEYVGLDPFFADAAAVETYLRRVMAPFGALTDADWQALATHAVRPADGGFRLAYDPAIRAGLLAAKDKDVDLWPIWDAIVCPVLLLWGRASDLLTADIVDGMTARGPQARLVAFDKVGHAPALRAADQIAAVRDWLLATK